MPATHLIRVDLPAPLSPTSAMTSPWRTSKSTSVSACTDPNDFEIPRSWRIGVSLTVSRFLPQSRWRRPPRAPPPVRPVRLLAELLELPDAHVALLQEFVREESRVVGLGDRDHLQGNGRLLLTSVLAEAVDPGHLLVPEQGDGGRGGSIGLGGHVLVGGYRLPAPECVVPAP